MGFSAVWQQSERYHVPVAVGRKQDVAKMSLETTPLLFTNVARLGCDVERGHAFIRRRRTGDTHGISLTQ